MFMIKLISRKTYVGITYCGGAARGLPSVLGPTPPGLK